MSTRIARDGPKAAAASTKNNIISNAHTIHLDKISVVDSFVVVHKSNHNTRTIHVHVHVHSHIDTQKLNNPAMEIPGPAGRRHKPKESQAPRQRPKAVMGILFFDGPRCERTL